MFYRPIADSKLKALLQLYQTSLKNYEQDAKATALLTGTSEKKAKPADAAMVVVANALFNLDEWVNKN
jgi:hypothetical protein